MKQYSLFMFFLLLSSNTWPCGTLRIEGVFSEKVIARNLPQCDTDAARVNGFCVACLDNEACIMNIGCGHVQYCRSCYKRSWLTYDGLLQAFLENRPGSWLPAKPSCPYCREAFVEGHIINLPFDAKCIMPKCRNLALVYHDSCSAFVFCFSCASKTGEQQIQMCMNCFRKDGCLKYCRFPDVEEGNLAMPFEVPDFVETN